MRCSVYIATSLDGFIARADGTLDWLLQADKSAAGEDYGYAAFMESVDYLVMGRSTYDFVRTMEPWPYAKPVVVLSRHRVEAPPRLAGKMEWMSATPAEIVGTLAARGAQHLYIDGGRTIQQFLAAELIDELIITRVPVLIGAGIPLFGPLPHDIRLRHVATHTYPSGMVQSRYAVLAHTFPGA